MPKLSIIIPIYNAAYTIDRCLQSILAQTLSDWEVICVNDGSSDNTQNILEKYALQDNRIKLISQNNRGSSAARQIGLDNAIGEYIAWVDADDYIDCDLYEKIFKYSNADVISFGYKRVDNDGTTVVNNLMGSKTKAELFHFHFTAHFQSLCTIVSKRSLWETYNIKFIPGENFCEDLNATSKVLAVATDVQILDLDSYYWYINNSVSMCNNLTEKHLKQRQNNIFDLHSFLSTLDNYESDILPSFAPVMLAAKQHLAKCNWRSYVEIAPEVNKFILSSHKIPLHKKLYLQFIVATYPIWKRFNP